jgi:hypothetical protein
MRVNSRSEAVLQTLALLRRLKRTAERGEARVRFVLQRKKRVLPLSEQQVREYSRDGYLIVSGLIPGNVVSGAAAAMWQSVGADAQAPETWPILGPHPLLLRDERLVAIYTDSMVATAAQLAGEHVASFRRPTHAFTVNNVPVSRNWQAHQPHLDYTIAELRHRTFPRPFRIGSIVYLTDVQRHGGGTIVWPGSHLKLEALARAEPRKYKYLSALSNELSRVALGPPVELTPSRGDVLFHHYLCAHASSDNVSGAPRLAVLHSW